MSRSLRRRMLRAWFVVGLSLTAFVCAVFWSLWSAVKEYNTSSFEKQVLSVLSGDLAEGNLFKLEATLDRGQKEGLLKSAEIRQCLEPGLWEVFYRTQNGAGDSEAFFGDFSCSSGRTIKTRLLGGVSLGVVLPAGISGAKCTALYLESDLSEKLKVLRNKLVAFLILGITMIIGFLLRYVSTWHKKILALETENLRAQIDKQSALWALAVQVAHDIRSPLAALDSVLSDTSALPEEQQSLARNAMGRIGEIARDLLDNYRQPGGKPLKNTEWLELKALIAPVIEEKRAQYSGIPSIRVDFVAAEVRAKVEAAELRRLVSNLVNNSVEAIQAGGRVAVELNNVNGRAVLSVSDTGKGISPDMLSELGQKDRTYGKAGGTGLGLYHTRTVVENWGGSFKIESELGRGTRVTIALPAQVARSHSKSAVLLDDDPLVHVNWRMSAKAAGVELKAYKTTEEFFAAVRFFPKDIQLYIDCDLGENVSGQRIVEELHADGFLNITMATGYPPAKFRHIPWLKISGKEPPWGLSS